ncbi:MAG TPA: 12,18-didecarboxysiroheme deacetylase [Lentisphaeria bacterium]|nr:MAG: 12,18-didecarboxysiroheme deacetylase [Lentisphaerae bacterium GWF2_38_69]HBM17370.1 12,18-didecarboxysiroheme deacetylase [Lentisphaeria bacterium]
MLSISKLYLGNEEYGDILRYKETRSVYKKPIVVWNLTSRCNLTCEHCYANAAHFAKNTDELSTQEGKTLIDDLAAFNVPVLLFSGGEPLARKDILELLSYASSKGLRTVLSSNGTLIDEEKARYLKRIGISYIGISVDGNEQTHDSFRHKKGAFQETMRGIRISLNAGLKVGLRFTMNKKNASDIDYIFNLVEQEGIHRICFYHLIPSGRGASIRELELNIEEKRKVMDQIINRTTEIYSKSNRTEILTVANHCDGIYLYLRMKKENHPDAEKILSFLRRNSSDSSGIGISSINWNGEVYPDQFWRNRILGNIRQEKFSEIWDSSKNEFMNKLLNRRKFIKGRCSRCHYLEICGGNFRSRSEYITGDTWASDPGCYLYDAEISGASSK